MKKKERIQDIVLTFRRSYILCPDYWLHRWCAIQLHYVRYATVLDGENLLTGNRMISIVENQGTILKSIAGSNIWSGQNVQQYVDDLL